MIIKNGSARFFCQVCDCKCNMPSAVYFKVTGDISNQAGQFETIEFALCGDCIDEYIIKRKNFNSGE